jgi:hypothetical protein
MRETTKIALRLLRQGYQPFPIVPCEKRPAIKDPEHLAARDEASVHQLFPDSGPHTGVAFWITTAGLIKVDLDSYKPEYRFPYEIPETWSIRTPSGGLNLLFKKDHRFRYRSRLYDPKGDALPAVEVITNGFQIMPPHFVHMQQSGRTIKGQYRTECDAPPAPMPDWLYTASFVPHERKAIRTEDQDITAAEVRRHLYCLRNDEVDWNHWKYIAGALYNCELEFGWEPGTALELWHEWSEKSPAYDEEYTDEQWLELKKYEEPGIHTIIWKTYLDPANQEYRQIKEDEWDQKVKEQLDNAIDPWE